MLRKLETVEKAFWQNAKIVVPADGDLVNVIGDLAGITPVPVKPAAPAQQPQRTRQAQQGGPGAEARPARPRPFRAAACTGGAA